MTLAGTNTYGGATTVADGTLLVSGSITSNTVTLGSAGGTSGTLNISAMGSHSLTSLSGNGIIDVDGSGSDLLTVTDIAPGFSIGTIEVTGNLTLTGTYFAEYASDNSSDRLDVSGTLDITNATLDLSKFGGGSIDHGNPFILAAYGSLTGGQFSQILGGYLSIDYNYNDLNQIVVYIPEPSSLAALLLLAGAGLLRRRRR